MNNEPVAWIDKNTGKPRMEGFIQTYHDIPLYTHPVKEQSTNERIEMLKEMVEKSANPLGWVGYQEGHLVSILKTQEQVNSFLTATDPTGRVEPVYTHPVKELTLTHEEYDNIFANGKRLGVIETENRLWKAMQLTDEEIIKVYENMLGVASARGSAIDFARAILRKAQEK